MNSARHTTRDLCRIQPGEHFENRLPSKSATSRGPIGSLGPFVFSEIDKKKEEEIFRQSSVMDVEVSEFGNGTVHIL